MIKISFKIKNIGLLYLKIAKMSILFLEIAKNYALFASLNVKSCIYTIFRQIFTIFRFKNARKLSFGASA